MKEGKLLKKEYQGKFAAALVLYNPADLYFLTAINILIQLGIDVYLYDNTPSEIHYNNNIKQVRARYGNIVKVVNTSIGNIGLAVAFNKIVSRVVAESLYDGIFVFDQDTNLNDNAIEILIENFNILRGKNVDFGIIAGYPIRKGGVPYRIRPIRTNVIVSDNLKAVKTVSSSFSLIPLETFENIGLFDEHYFIDHIDMDFSMRSWKIKKPVYIQTDAKFTHNVGIGDVKFFGKFLFPIADPYRHYYQVRNMILSYRKNNVNSMNIFYHTLQRSIVVLIISIHSGDVVNRFKFLIKGIKDGLRGVTGKINSTGTRASNGIN